MKKILFCLIALVSVYVAAAAKGRQEHRIKMCKALGMNTMCACWMKKGENEVVVMDDIVGPTAAMPRTMKKQENGGAGNDTAPGAK